MWVSRAFFFYSSLILSSIFYPLFYLFVGLGVQNAHALHRQAAVAQRTDVTAEARGGVHALHSKEAGVKLALQEGKRTRALLKLKNVCGSHGASPQKAFRFDDTFAHAKKRMLKGPVLIKRGQCKHDKTHTHPCTSILMRTSLTVMP